jgi:O-antigen/teichoic acid export membrane protein
MGRIAQMSAVLATSNLFGGLIALATSMVIARGLGREEFGRWIFCTAAISVLTAAFDLGFSVLLTREAARGSVGALWSNAFATRLVLFLPVGAIACVAVPATGIGAASSQAIHVGIAVAIAGIAYGCVAAVFRASPRRLLEIAVVDMIGAGVRLVGAAVMISRGTTIPDLLALTAAVQIAQFVVAFTVWRRIAPDDRLARPSIGTAWATLRRAVPFALTGLVANAQSRVASLVLGYFSDAAETASFGVASRIGSAARRLPQAALTAGMPVFAQELGRSDAARERFDGILRYFGVAAACGLVVLAQPILALTYGQSFVTAAPAVIWTALGLMPWLANNARKMHLYSSGQERVALRWSAVALVVQTAGCLIVVPGFGAAGAAAAMLAGEAVVWLPLRLHEAATIVARPPILESTT